MRRRHAALLRLGITLALLATLAWQLNTGEILARLGTLSPLWVAAGIALSLPQVVISAWRWRLTARYVGIALPWPRALREYYLATFLNQILPGGVMGDATRAWRHGSRADAGQRGAAIRAVIIERASGQIALVLVALIPLAAAAPLRDAIVTSLSAAQSGWPWAIAAAALLGLVAVIGLRHPALSRALASLGQDLRQALLGSRVWPRQLLSSLLVVATYVAVFLCAARALELPRSLGVLLPLIPPLLLAMAIPLSVAGWGLREGAAALIWPLAGLPAQEGVTLSITYGLLILLGSLPGALVLARDHWAERRRPGAVKRAAVAGNREIG
ncbi:lysylphosphatidylglycerol synthase transmembrane domain-containing protein [Salinicola sp. RZ23]|uniref:lysylphosphatidylglycerol synthase transmembrane domain-containing protein n=1 Tax=Salinicola sp. RZ23 TaxID=1949087 RepID=UPI00130058B1|nr:lysylphosphatidylglycerol synthase transmembrane domain-containing protein [Salinicola sp. RZ23]